MTPLMPVRPCSRATFRTATRRRESAPARAAPAAGTDVSLSFLTPFVTPAGTTSREEGEK